jgi:hypothetical protein
MLSIIQLLAAAGIIVASTVHAQTPEGARSSSLQHGYSTAGASIPGGPARVHATPNLVDRAGVSFTPIDGSRALLGKWPSAISVAPGDGAGRSSFLAEVRGDVTTNSSGEAEFGGAAGSDGSASGFVVSLGARGSQSAILFTRMSGAPLGVGRYRISDRGNGAAELVALVITGPPSDPTGVFRGRSGWLVVTAASDHLISGRFQVDGVGFLAAEPRAEDRAVNASGSFSATQRGRD